MRWIKTRTVFIIVLLCLAWLVPGGVSAADDDWTLMVYLDGDNNLEDAAIYDFLEMRAIGSDSNVNIVALFDRVPGYSAENGDWEDTRRGIIRQGDVPSDGSDGFQPWGESVGEKNMGDPQTLIEFVMWGMVNYPATNYGIVLWNHGNGWRSNRSDTQSEGDDSLPYKSVCSDDTDGDTLYMKEVRSALDYIEDHGYGLQMNFVGFDACLMGMVEVAYEIHEHADVMVGSESLVPNNGWPYNTILSDLVGDPIMTAAELGSVVVSRYDAAYGDRTMSAIDLSELDTLAARTDTLAQALIDNWDVNSTSCAQAAFDVIEAVDSAVIAENHGSTGPGSHGLAIYFPEDIGDYNTMYNEGVVSKFPADTHWGDFLEDFHSSMGGSWVATARAQSKAYDLSGKTPGCQCHYIDLYDFCEKIMANADNIYVDFDHTGTQNGTFYYPFNTMYEATQALGGDTLYIYAGETDETITITKALTLRAYGGTVVIGQSP